MTLHSKIIMSDKVDMERMLPFLLKAANVRAIKVNMISMAGANQPGERRWYVLQTRDRMESSVEISLKKAHVQTYLPLVDGGKRLVRHRMISNGNRPAMPGYVMVCIVPSKAAFAGLIRIGRPGDIIGLVGGNENPHWISEKNVNRFKMKLGDLAEAAIAPDRFKKGDVVRFEEGPFLGFKGIIVSIRKKVAIRGEAPIPILGRIEVKVGNQLHVVDTPLAFVEKL